MLTSLWSGFVASSVSGEGLALLEESEAEHQEREKHKLGEFFATAICGKLRSDHFYSPSVRDISLLKITSSKSLFFYFIFLGNDILSSCLYTSGLCASYAGMGLCTNVR